MVRTYDSVSHNRNGDGDCNEGQTVQYEIESNRGKESAVNLKVSK